jgi:uncharacterized protein (TIGR00297 family)
MSIFPILLQVLSIQLLAGLILSLVMALISYQFKIMTFSGAIGMVIIGTIIFGLGGVIFAVPLIFFFISSYIFTRIKSRGKDKSLIAIGKAGPRDIYQVLANGGVGAIIVIIYIFTGNFIWFFPYLTSLCEAASDTWATELGTLHPDSPVSIVSFERVDPGRSGGVTILGTLSAIGGALMTMLVAYGAWRLNVVTIPFATKAWIIAANCGLAGALLDSVLGGSVQAQYRCPVCLHWTEWTSHCGAESELTKGYRLINNDLVNFASCLFASLMATAIIMLNI